MSTVIPKPISGAGEYLIEPYGQTYEVDAQDLVAEVDGGPLDVEVKEDRTVVNPGNETKKFRLKRGGTLLREFE